MSADAALTPSPLCCDEVEPLLPLVADGAIDAAADPAIFEHLARCQDCQDCLARHDLVHLGLERGRTSKVLTMPPMRGWHYRLPWPAAAAVLSFVALGLLLWPQNGAPLPASADRSSAQRVISMPGSDPQHPRYAVFQGGHEEVIDPQAVDGAFSEPKPVLPAKFDVQEAKQQIDR